MGSAALTALIWALAFAVPTGVLSAFRKNDGSVSRGAVVTGNIVVVGIVLFVINYFIFYFGMPATAWYNILPNILLCLLIAAIVTSGFDVFAETPGAGLVVWLVVIALGITWIAGHNGPHDPVKASQIVSVTDEPKAQLPPSSTNNMVVVSPDIAQTKAQQAMSNGVASQQNYNTYLNLGTGTLQFVDGHMWYVFPMNFDGSRNKSKLNGVVPGYIMVSGEDPGAKVQERYNGNYSMKICVMCGQDSEPTRWAYDHGYHNTFDDPTLEIDDQGNPYWTETILTPHLGWTFNAPSSVLVINAHTGQINQYALDKVPSWVDRVYSQSMASTIAGWFGNYDFNGKAGWNGWGSTNAGRYQVSGDPVLVYTGDGHPDWRILLTSYNKDTAVSRILIVDAHSGAMRVYYPQNPMGIESSLTGDNGAFVKPSGQGASTVYANRYVPTDLTLHVIYGHLTWMATYESGGSSSSFEGLGFVDAYNASANNVVFGNSKTAALQNYLVQLSKEGTSNGSTPSQGASYPTVTGLISLKGSDTSGGQTTWYFELNGDTKHVYVGTTDSVGPAVVLAPIGDSVTIRYIDTGDLSSLRTMQFFSDPKVPLSKAGS